MADLRWDYIRAEHQKDYRRVLDRAFELTMPASYLADFPVWNPSITKQANRIQVGGWKNARLVSTASLRIVEYLFSDGTKERLGLIGAVATDPEFSGQGLASFAIDRALEEGRNQGLKTFTLWGSESPIYKNRGFQFAGIQLRTPLERIAIEGEIPEGYEIRTGWDDLILDNLYRRPTGVRYSETDLLWLSKQHSVEWRTILFEGKFLAHCGWNRGIDLPNIIHEIEGTPEGKRALLLFVKRKYPHLELLHHPSHVEFGIRAIAQTEKLAQFIFDGPENIFAKNIDSLWFSGMDSC